MTAPTLRHCANHPQRAAYALCMSCRKDVCQACATQWDGIYHCTACLAARRSASTDRASLGGWFALSAGVLATLWLSAKAMVWAAALIAGML